MAFDIFDREHEVVVAGGGLVGWSAAMTLARAGRKVVLAARRPCLGWEITAGFETRLGMGAEGLAGEIYQRLEKIGAAGDGQVTPAAVELLLDEMATEAGVELQLYATPLGAVMSDEEVKGLVVGSKQGQDVLRSGLVVDATDLATVGRKAGVDVKVCDGVKGQMTLFIEQCEVVDKPLLIGDVKGAKDVTVSATNWEGELAVRYMIDSMQPGEGHDLSAAVLEAVREKVSAIAEGIVSAMSIEPVAMGVRYELAEGASESVKGLVVAAGDRGATIAEFIACGEKLGADIDGHYDDLKGSGGGGEVDQGLLLEAPPHEKADVLVVGGGTAGAVAAIAAARSGAKTRLLEPLTYLGGIGSGGGIHWYYIGVKGGLQDDVDKRVDALSPLYISRHKMWGFHPDAKKVALYQLAIEAGVEISFASTAIEVVTQPVEETAVARVGGGVGQQVVKVSQVIAAEDEGIKVYEADVVIDSTGDGDIAAKAGARFERGREGDGQSHAYSQPAGLMAKLDDEPGRLFMKHANFDAGFVDPDDVTDLSRARQLGLEHLRLEKWTNDKRWIYVAPHIGLRQSRQIVGDYQLTLADQINGRTFEDVIAYGYSHYDNHAFDYGAESDAAVAWVWLLGQWQTRIGCEVPYRCMLPVGVEGLLVACRAVSITQDAHHQLRMQRDMQRIGEAAGFAAAIASKAGVTPRTVDIKAVQEELRQYGALEEKDRPAAAIEQMSGEQLVESFSGEAAPKALWQVAGGDKQALPVLKKALESENTTTRYWAASALALANDPVAGRELLAVLKERRDEQPEGVRQSPKWYPAMILLGRLGDKAAVPEIARVMADKDVAVGMVVAAVRALGRIGDPAGVDAVRQLLERDDLDSNSYLQNSVSGKSVVDEGRWRVDLACAEALWKMGAADRGIVEKYLADNRAYVRRAVKQLLAEMDS